VRLRNLIPYIPKSLPLRWTSLLAHLAVAAVSLVSLAAQTAPQSSRELVLTVGKSLVVNSAASIERVSVGYGDIADARAVSPNEILLNGKAAGETSLIVWQQGGNKLFFDVVVRPNTTGVRTKLERCAGKLQEQLPVQDIKGAMDNDLVCSRRWQRQDHN
jgi:pilus assembly protein CpaC